MRKKLNKRIRKIIIFFIILISWELVSRFTIYPKSLFPSVIDIIKELIKSFSKGRLLDSVFYSLIILFKGLIITFIIAFVLVTLSELFILINDILEIFITIAHPLPGIAIIPLVILWIGIGEKAILFIIIHAMLWPVVINLKSGIKSINKSYLKLSEAFNFSIYKKVLHIYFMGIIPNLVSGLEIAWARGWRALISSEMVFGVVGSSTGLGWYIFEQRVYMNTPGLYAGLLVIIILGFLIENLVFEKIKLKTIKRWG